MTSTKYKLGELIEQLDDRNIDEKYGLNDVRGISIQKIFIDTKADMAGVPLKPYKLVSPGDFAYVTVTSRNSERITLAHNTTDSTYIVSTSYVVFRVNKTDILLPEYLYIYFNRPEFDRYARFNSWGSARETFAWEDMCDIEIDLPPIKIQKKYVDIYNAMIANQVCYERGLEDLKLTCEGYIEDLRRKIPLEKIGNYIECTDRKTNNDKLVIMGISNKQTLQPPNSRVDGVDKKNYLQIDPREFGYSPIHINEGSIALNDRKQSFLLSPIYKTFKVKDESKLLPEYLMLWFSRSEFVRYCNFHAFGSARDTFDWVQMLEVTIPIPGYEIQQSITSIFKVYTARKKINDCLKKQIKDICPILIKGSLEEANK